MSSLIAIVNGDGSPAPGAELGGAIESSLRGPDGHGVWTEGPIGLAHGLLDTGGASTTAQPASLDGEIWIAADARLDDRASLVRALDAERDRRLPARSALADAPAHELLLHSYRLWGRRCVERLLGDFAFAIWDARERTLFCARDQLGVAPLFYAVVGERLIVASELERIRSFAGVDDRLDDLAVADYLMFGLIQDPEATIFATVRRLPPAHTLSWSNGRVEIERYWELRTPETTATQSDPVAELEEILAAAVDDRLRDTETAGISFSGGIDSSLVAALATRAGTGPLDLRAETVVFDRLIDDDERSFATIAAQALDIPVEFRTADRIRLFEGWEEPGRVSPEPESNPTAALHTASMRSLARHSRVGLTGYDGDSLCQVWLPSHFRRLLQHGRMRRAVREIRQLSRLTGSFPPKGATGAMAPWISYRRRRQAAGTFPAWLDPELVDELDLRDRWRAYHAPSRPWSRAVEADAIELLTGAVMRDTLDSYDPARMKAPVDVRHPLLDLRVIEYCLTLPPIPWKVDKTILRRIAAHRLPASISERPKTPLSADPVDEALGAGEPILAEQHLRSERTERWVRPTLLPPLGTLAGSEAIWPRIWVAGLDLWLQRTAP